MIKSAIDSHVRTSGTDLDRTGSGGRHGRLFRLTAGGLVASMVAGMLSVIAVASVLTATSSPAGASTTSVAAVWSGSGPNITGFVTATPPAGTLSATVTLNGGGGGGGAAGGNATSGSTSVGGAGGQVTGTFALDACHGPGRSRTGRWRWGRQVLQQLDRHLHGSGVHGRHGIPDRGRRWRGDDGRRFRRWVAVRRSGRQCVRAVPRVQLQRHVGGGGRRWRWRWR